MNLCSRKHEEVCFESNVCPACEALDELKTAKEEISFLEEQVKILNDQ